MFSLLAGRQTLRVAEYLQLNFGDRHYAIHEMTLPAFLCAFTIEVLAPTIHNNYPLGCHGEIYWGGVGCCWNATRLYKKVVWNKKMDARVRDWRTVCSLSSVLHDHGQVISCLCASISPNIKRV